MVYQWYPGHMTKARRMMEENIKMIDLIIELTDARSPMCSRNPDIDSLGKGKLRLVILNKADLADEGANQAWLKYFESQGIRAVCVNAGEGKGVKQIQSVIKDICKEKTERDRKRGIIGRPVRAMVAGIPNVGKSTLINSIVGKGAAKTGNKPGVTKGKQWIHLNKELELLDTPGILWPKFEDQQVGMKLAMLGSMNDEVLQIEELSLDLIRFLQAEYPGKLQERYASIGEETDPVKILEAIGRGRGCLKKGNEIDYEKAANLLLDEFRSGKIGRISLERPQ